MLIQGLVRRAARSCWGRVRRADAAKLLLLLHLLLLLLLPLLLDLPLMAMVRNLWHVLVLGGGGIDPEVLVLERLVRVDALLWIAGQQALQQRQLLRCDPSAVSLHQLDQLGLPVLVLAVSCPVELMPIRPRLVRGRTTYIKDLCDLLQLIVGPLETWERPYVSELV